MVVAAGIFFPAGGVAQKLEVMKLLPDEFKEYRATDWLDYSGEALYDYINGGAEMYMSYGLVGMTGCKYNGEGMPQITVEVYEMTESRNAFGVFTQNRDREEYDYGQGSQSFNDFILFWKDKYFVIVSAQKATPESTEAIRFMAKTVDKAIEGKGTVPAIVDALPREGLMAAGFLYFHHYIWLNAYMFIADFNILNIGAATDAVLGKYGPSDARAILLLVDYPDSGEAIVAGRQLRDKYAPEWTEQAPAVILEDGSWFALGIMGRRLVAVFNGNSREQADWLLNSVNK